MFFVGRPLEICAEHLFDLADDATVGVHEVFFGNQNHPAIGGFFLAPIANHTLRVVERGLGRTAKPFARAYHTAGRIANHRTSTQADATAYCGAGLFLIRHANVASG